MEAVKTNLKVVCCIRGGACSRSAQPLVIWRSRTIFDFRVGNELLLEAFLHPHGLQRL